MCFPTDAAVQEVRVSAERILAVGIVESNHQRQQQAWNDDIAQSEQGITTLHKRTANSIIFAQKSVIVRTEAKHVKTHNSHREESQKASVATRLPHPLQQRP